MNEKNKFKKNYIIIIAFLLILSLYFLGSVSKEPKNIQCKVEKGVLDLKDWDFNKNGAVLLNGDWEFYWGKLLEPSDFLEPSEKQEVEYAKLPFVWKDTTINDTKISGRGYATFRMVIYTKEKEVGLVLPIMLTANKLWINGELLAQSGTVGKNIDETVPKELYHTIKIDNESDRIELVLQVANFHIDKGGITKSIILDRYSIVTKNRYTAVIFEAFLAGILFIMFIYHLVQYLLNREMKESLYFSLFCLGFVFRTLVSGQKILLILTPSITWIWVVKISLLSVVSVGFFMFFIYSLFPKEANIYIVHVIIILWEVYAVWVLFCPEEKTNYPLYFADVLVLLVAIYILKVLFSAYINKRKDVIPILIGTVVMILTGINDILFSLRIIHGYEIATIGLVAFLFSQSYVVASRFSRAIKEANYFSNKASCMNEKLKELNSSLELKVDERTKEIHNLLDNVGQGFLSFGKDMIINKEYSRECEAIFETHISNKSILDLFYDNIELEEYNVMKSVFDKVFETDDPYIKEVYMSLVPNEIIINQKYIKLEYKLFEENKEDIVMFILTDITENKEIEEKMEKEKNNLRMVVYAVSNSSEVKGELSDFKYYFNNEAYILLETKEKPEDCIKEIYRNIHTYKGIFAQHCMHNASKMLHEIENNIKEIENSNYGMKDVKKLLDSIDPEVIIKEEKDILIDILGDAFFDKADIIAISTEKLDELEETVISILEPKEANVVINKIKRIRYKNLKDILHSYDEYIQTLSESLNKKIMPLDIYGDDFYIDYKKYRSFIKSFIHIFKNKADHGIEDPETREELGKKEEGYISCRIKKGEDRQLILRILDDGAPINIEKIKRKAIDIGLYTKEELKNLSDYETMQIIFADKFSTKTEVNIVSGRGVGLSAIRMEVEKIGGNICVEELEDAGTVFNIRIPLREGMDW